MRRVSVRSSGPRIVTAGSPITITGGHCHFLGLEADSKADVRRVARQQIRDGVNCLKIMASGGRMTPGTNPKLPQYSVGQLSAAVEEARRAGHPARADPSRRYRDRDGWGR